MRNRNLIRSMSFEFLLGVSAIWTLLAGGCASDVKLTYEAKIKNLDADIARLKSEKVNWDAHANALDDELTVIKKKLERCQKQDDKRKLAVVTLAPPEEEPVARGDAEAVDDSDASSDIESFEEVNAGPPPKPGKGRPVLVLRGGASRESGGGRAEEPGGAEPAAFAEWGPESLGVASSANTGAADPFEPFNTAYRAYANKEYDEALKLFSKFIQENPSHEYADNAIFWRGECYLAEGKFLKAIGEFERLLQRYPDSDQRPACLYRIGFAWDKFGDKGKALEYYFQVVEKHPGSEAARSASRRVSAIRGEGKQAGNLLPAAQAR